jgi:hypothetical protein
MARRTDQQIDTLVDELARHGLAPEGGGQVGVVNPARDQLRELVREDRSGPLQFVNLLAYREFADYPAGHDLAATGLTGAEAYGLYGAVALDHVTRRGGRLTTYNDVEQVIIGPEGGWHQVATMQYADTEAFIDMLLDPDYIEALVHREAGLANTVVLVTRPLLPVD